MTDDLGRTYRLRPVTWGDAPGEPGRRRWRGEVLAEPQPGRQPATCGDGRVRWLEFAGAESQPVRVDMPAPAAAETGPAEPAWPTPAEAYLAELASARSVTIATGEDSVELDVAKIVAAVADALLWTGALPPDSAMLSAREAPAPGWQEELAELWGRQAHLRARDNEPERAGLAVCTAATAGHGGDREHRRARRPRVHPAVRASVAERRVLADDRAELPGAGDR